MNQYANMHNNYFDYGEPFDANKTRTSTFSKASESRQMYSFNTFNGNNGTPVGFFNPVEEDQEYMPQMSYQRQITGGFQPFPQQPPQYPFDMYAYHQPSFPPELP
jgi:hypothetical protein